MNVGVGHQHIEKGRLGGGCLIKVLITISPLCAVLSRCRVQLFVTSWTVASRVPLSIGILQARMLEWDAMTSSGALPKLGIEPWSPAGSLPSEPAGKPKNTGVGSLVPSPGELPAPGIKPGSPVLQLDTLPAERPEKPGCVSMKQLLTYLFCQW